MPITLLKKAGGGKQMQETLFEFFKKVKMEEIRLEFAQEVAASAINTTIDCYVKHKCIIQFIIVDKKLELCIENNLLLFEMNDIVCKR